MLEKKAKKNNKIALVSGNFNVIHPGHQRLFRFAKQNSDKLIVAVNSDLIAGSDAYINQNLRFEGVESNTWVDEVVLNDISVEDLILKIKPDLVVKGSEHEHEKNSETGVIDQIGSRLVFFLVVQYFRLLIY